MSSSGSANFGAELLRRQLIGESPRIFTSPQAPRHFASLLSLSPLLGLFPNLTLESSPTEQPTLQSLPYPAELTKSPPEGISVGPKDDNLFLWEILLVGPPGTALCVCERACCRVQLSLCRFQHGHC